MARLLDRMRVGTKLTLIALAYTVPIGTLLLRLVREQNIAIDFTTREREGGHHLSPLVHALSALSTRAMRAHGAEPSSARVDAVLGASLQTDNASLSTKGRSQLSVPTLRRERDNSKTSTAAAREPAVAAFVTNLRSLVAHIGDTSNLTLDPERRRRARVARAPGLVASQPSRDRGFARARLHRDPNFGKSTTLQPDLAPLLSLS